MAKRFTDTNKYRKPFIRGLQGAYKLLWDYLYHDCDHAGIWIVDFEVAQIYLGSDMPVNKIDALKYFNDGEKRIIEIDNGSKWFIPSFIKFQYGELNEANRAHNSVILILKNYKLYNKGLISSLHGAMDKDKDKDKDIDENKIIYFNDKEVNDLFNEYLLLRKKKLKLSNSDSVIDRLKKKLREYSDNKQGIALEIINKAITSSWKDFYPLKTN